MAGLSLLRADLSGLVEDISLVKDSSPLAGELCVFVWDVLALTGDYCVLMEDLLALVDDMP